MPRKGTKRKKTRTHRVLGEDEDKAKKTPKCFIVRRGLANGKINDLVRDMRDVMSPNTAKNMKEKQKNKIKDFTNIAGPLGVTHLMCMHSTESASYMKLCTLPQGPTLTFKISEFTLSSDVKATQKRPRNSLRDFVHAPLLVMNGFGSKEKAKSKELELASSTLKQMFAPIDVRTHSIGGTKRVALFNYDAAKNLIEFRHYAVKQAEAGLSRGIRKILRPKRKLDLSRSKDIGDYITGGGYASDSEVEDNVPIPGVKDKKDRAVAISLQELGPRLHLRLIKVEDGVMNGNVLFEEKFVNTEAELKLKEERFHAREELKKKLDKDKREKKTRKRELREAKAENIRKKMKLGGEISDEEEEEDAIPVEGRRTKYNPFHRARAAKGEKAEKEENVIEFGSDDEQPARKQTQEVKKHRKKKPSMGGRQRKKATKA